MPAAKKKSAPALDPKLVAIMAEINKDMGLGTIILGSDIHYESIPRITSGSLSLDVALGGGWTVNSWHEIYGEASSGKSVVIAQTIVANQIIDPDYMTLWIASEEFVPAWARTQGMDLSRVIVYNDNGMEPAYGAIIKALDERIVDCIVVDSMPALLPIAEDEGDMANKEPGTGARLNNKFFRKQGAVSKRSLIDPTDRPVTCFMVNQWREKIGVMWGDPRTTPGGKGKDFAYFTRTELRRDEWLIEGTKSQATKVGITIKALIKKNKTAPPERVATFDFYFADSETGILAGSYDPLKEILALGRYFGVIAMGGGGMYSYGDQKWKGQGALMEQLRWDLTLQADITQAVMTSVVKGKPLGEVVAAPAPTPAPAPAARRTVRRVK